MSAIVIAGDTSGTITLQAPAVAGSTVITLPSSNTTLLGIGQAANTNVLFSDSGAANGSTAFSFNKSTNNVTLNGTLTYNGKTFSNSATGTGSMVLSNAPTITGNLTYGGVTLTNTVTGTGSMVLSASPTLTGNATTANLIVGSASGLTYGGVTLSNSVTGTGSMVLSAAPTLTGAATAANLTLTGTLTSTTNNVIASILSNIVEPTTLSNTAAANTINFDVMTQSVIYYTANATGNWTMNFRANSTVTLNNALATGQTITVVFLATQGGTAYYNNLVQIDSTNTTPKYQGGTAWSAGNASGIDGYTYSITKTANATFNLLASQTQYK